MARDWEGWYTTSAKYKKENLTMSYLIARGVPHTNYLCKEITSSP